jgi:general nucleoside transport system permease protein
MLDGIVLERRQHVARVLATASFAGGLLAAAAISILVLLAAGASAGTLWDDLIVQVFLTPDGLAQTATIAVPLVLVGLSSTLAMRLRFWNIGIEGQLWLGAIGATAVALHDVGPEPLRLPLMLATAALFGAMWIAFPLLLKLRFGVSEIVLSLLLSNVAYLYLQHLLFGAWRDPAYSFPVSIAFDPAERLSPLGLGSLHAGLWIALAATAVIALIAGHTRLGFYATAIGLNPMTARATGLPVTKSIIAVVLMSGALSGLAGGVIVAGTEYRLTQFIGANATFSGIVIACLAFLRPAGVLVAALAVAGVYNAGTTLKVFYGLSEATVLLIQGIVLLCLLIGQFFGTYRIAVQRGAGRA